MKMIILLNFFCDLNSEELNKSTAEKADEPTERSFSALPLHLQPDGSRPSSPAGDSTRCSTPTISLVVGSVPINPAVKELALELLKVFKISLFRLSCFFDIRLWTADFQQVKWLT